MWIETETGKLINMDHIDSISIVVKTGAKVELQAYSARLESDGWILCTGKEKCEEYKDKIAEKLEAYKIPSD